MRLSVTSLRRVVKRDLAIEFAPRVTGYETELVISQWNDLRLRVVLYRKHVGHQTRRNLQLDLFTPDNGHFEYSAVATTLPWGRPPCGRWAQEKIQRMKAKRPNDKSSGSVICGSVSPRCSVQFPWVRGPVKKCGKELWAATVSYNLSARWQYE